MYAMPHHDGLPLVFQFPEEDTQPESQEHKALWDELELALRENAAPVPAPVSAPVALTAPAPIVGVKTDGSWVGGPDLCVLG